MFVHLWHLNKSNFSAHNTQYFVLKLMFFIKKCVSSPNISTFFYQICRLYSLNITFLIIFEILRLYSKNILTLLSKSWTIVFLTVALILLLKEKKRVFLSFISIRSLFLLKTLNFINIYWSQSTNQFILSELPVQVVRNDLCAFK